MDFQAYLKDLPLLHSWDNGVTWNTGGFDAAQLAVFHRLAGGNTGGRNIIETGAGNSTITFLYAKPSRLVSIAPSAPLFERIVAYLKKAAVRASALQCVVERSELALPFLARDEYLAGRQYDLGLIDGSHGWPAVFVDFCYVNALLRKGGVIIVDDVQLHSCKELARLLAEQPGYKLIENLGKALAFEKQIDAVFLGEHGSQPYIAKRTEAYLKSPNQFAL